MPTDAQGKAVSLRERTAKAICGKGCDMPKCSIQPSANSRAVCRQISLDHADAAIALVLEEAAKVADQMLAEHTHSGEFAHMDDDDHDAGARAAARAIAAAIRSLSSHGEKP